MPTRLMQKQFPSVGTHTQPSLHLNHQSNLQGFPNSRNEEQRHVDKSNITGHSQNPAILKGIGLGALERSTVPTNASNSFTGSTAQYFQNSKIAHSSHNMLELLHKVDQSKDFIAAAAPDMTGQAVVESTSFHPKQSAAIQGCGLQLAPPSQRQPSNYGVPLTVNDSNKQLDKELDREDPSASDSAPSVQPYNRESSHKDNLDSIANISKQKLKETSDPLMRHDNFPSNFSEFQYVGNQFKEQNKNLQHPQQHHQLQNIVNSSGLEAFTSGGNQTNANSLVSNMSQQQQSHSSHDNTGPLPSSGIVSAETHSTAGSGFYSTDGKIAKQAVPVISHNKTSGQEFPIAGTRSRLHSSMSGVSQQAGSSKMFHKVWTNISSQQHPAGLQPQKLTPQLLQSILSSGRGASLLGLRKEVDQENRGDSVSSEAGRSPSNSHNDEHEITNSDKVGISRWQEPDHKFQFDGSSVASLTSLTHLDPQDASKGKKGQESSVSSQQIIAPATDNISASSQIGASRHTLLAPKFQQQNYSLLHQMQAMKDGDSDSDKLLGKRARSTDMGSCAQDWNTSQKLVYGQKGASRVLSDSEDMQSLQSQRSMFHFIPKDAENNVSTAAVAQVSVGNQINSLSSSTNFVGGVQHPQINPQMAPSWFEKYGNYKNGMVVANYDGQKIANVSSHPYFLPRIPGIRESNAVVEQRTESFQAVYPGNNLFSSTISANESSQCSVLPSGVDHGMVLSPKRQKHSTSDLASWHKVVTQGSRSFFSISMMEQVWAQATNRLIDKVETEVESLDDGPSTSQPRRRLILTTKLMQHLLSAVPARMLKDDAANAFESVAFCVAKSALADACNLICSTDSNVGLDPNNMIPKMLKNSGRIADNMLLEVIENFIARVKKLENDFLRLEKRTSFLDVRLECQELERFSIVNRLGKFHGRPNSEGAEGSSASEAANRKTFPQRYVTAISLPGDIPDGVPCLSL